MSSVQQKLQDNQTEQCNPCIGKKIRHEKLSLYGSRCWMDIVGKNFKAGIMNLLKDLKKIMFKELKEGMMTMSHHREYQ